MQAERVSVKEAFAECLQVAKGDKRIELAALHLLDAATADRDHFRTAIEQEVERCQRQAKDCDRAGSPFQFVAAEIHREFADRLQSILQRAGRGKLR